MFLLFDQIYVSAYIWAADTVQWKSAYSAYATLKVAHLAVKYLCSLVSMTLILARDIHGFLQT